MYQNERFCRLQVLRPGEDTEGTQHVQAQGGYAEAQPGGPAEQGDIVNG